MLELLPLVLGLLLTVGYAGGLVVLRRRGAGWPSLRTVALLAAGLCIALATLPPLGTHEDHLTVHMVQHLLLAMAAPALLALSAPVTLALRTLPARPRRVLLTVVHSGPVGVLTTPAVVLGLNIGSLALLYLTGLYARTLDHDAWHAAVHLHLFLVGCLFSWTIIGIDPMPRRPRVRTRLSALLLAAVAHDTVSKLLYARDLPAGGGTTPDRQAGAQLMYYGGTAVDVLLAVALMAQWYARSGRALAAARRRAGAQPGLPDTGRP